MIRKSVRHKVVVSIAVLGAAGASLHLATTAYAQPSVDAPPPNSLPGKPPEHARGHFILPIDEIPHGWPEETKAFLAEMKKKGYRTVPPETIDRFSIAHHRASFVPLDQVQLTTTAPLSMIGRPGPFGTMELAGVIPSRPTKGGKWTHIDRIFRLPNNGIVSVSEWDYVAAGVSIYVPAEGINTQVHSHPASFSVLKSKRGDALSLLTWATDRKSYQITMTGHVRGLGNENLLIQLAESIQE